MAGPSGERPPLYRGWSWDDDCNDDLCCAACACNHFLSRRTAGGKGRAAGCQSHWCLERQVVHCDCAACCSWNLTRVRCQRHATATKAYNRASAQRVRPSRWTLLSLLGNRQADQFVYNWHPNFERSNYRENCAYYNGISTVLYNE